jgi:hypothetical protein
VSKLRKLKVLKLSKLVTRLGLLNGIIESKKSAEWWNAINDKTANGPTSWSKLAANQNGRKGR